MMAPIPEAADGLAVSLMEESVAARLPQCIVMCCVTLCEMLIGQGGGRREAISRL